MRPVDAVTGRIIVQTLFFPLSIYNVYRVTESLSPTHCVDEDINAGGLADVIEESDFFVIVPGVGINDTGEQLGNGNLLHITHALHHVNSDHAVERTSQSVDFLADAALDTDGVEDGAFVGVNVVVGINHLDQEADDGGLLCLVKKNLYHVMNCYQLIVNLVERRRRHRHITLCGRVASCVLAGDHLLGAGLPLPGTENAFHVLGIDHLTLLQ